MKIRYRWWVDAPCWFIFLITGHDMKLVIGGAGVYLTILLDAVKPRLVGFGVGAFTHIFTHELFWVAISRVLEADH